MFFRQFLFRFWFMEPLFHSLFGFKSSLGAPVDAVWPPGDLFFCDLLPKWGVLGDLGVPSGALWGVPGKKAFLGEAPKRTIPP